MKKKISIACIIILFIVVALVLICFFVNNKNETTNTYNDENLIYENETSIQEDIDNNANKTQEDIQDDVKDEITNQIKKEDVQENKGETTKTTITEKTQEASKESDKQKTSQTNIASKDNSNNQSNTSNKNNTTNQNNTTQKNKQEETTNKTKSIYDYEFDIDKIKSELISIGKGMGLKHITEDDGVIRTPNNSSWSNPITASKSFQGDKLERALKDYVRSMPSLVETYGGNKIEYFTIYVKNNGNGSYTFYFLY